MSRLPRPALTPVPWRQALIDRVHNIDPRRAARQLLAVMLVALLAQLGWQWRSTTVQLGRRQTVVVVQRTIDAGETITVDDIAITGWPVGLVPSGALTALPHDAVASADLAAGEALVGQRLFPTPSGVAADELLVTIPQPLAAPPVTRGSRVELFGILPIGDGLVSPARLLTSGTVIVVTESAISIAISASAAPTVVEHTVLGTVELVVRP